MNLGNATPDLGLRRRAAKLDRRRVRHVERAALDVAVRAAVARRSS